MFRVSSSTGRTLFEDVCVACCDDWLKRWGYQLVGVDWPPAVPSVTAHWRLTDAVLQRTSATDEPGFQMDAIHAFVRFVED
jgi:hypothetical protein